MTSEAVKYGMPPDTGLIDYLAMQICLAESRAAGTIPPRWMCMRADLRKAYLRKARDQYIAWVADERQAEQNRASP